MANRAQEDPCGRFLSFIFTLVVACLVTLAIGRTFLLRASFFERRKRQLIARPAKSFCSPRLCDLQDGPIIIRNRPALINC